MHLEYFQMIDTISAIDRETGTIDAIAIVPDKSTIFEGHFPTLPLLPGVLLIETMAQASGYLLLDRLKFESMPFLVAVSEAKLRTFVEPGTELNIAAEIVHDGSGFSVSKAEVTSAGKRICNTRLTFRIMPFPKDELRQEMLKRFDEIYPAGGRS
jgi:3-hydroxyacyl-[acyl-carrier-protein] dehydratase